MTEEQELQAEITEAKKRVVYQIIGSGPKKGQDPERWLQLAKDLRLCAYVAAVHAEDIQSGVLYENQATN